MGHLQMFLLIAALQLQHGMVMEKSDKHYSLEYLYKMAGYCWAASPYNPSWGSREEVTLKLMGSYYYESGLNPCSFNGTRNKNKTTDTGLGQINSVHLAKTFPAFCRRLGIPYKPELIWDPAINAKFGAYINELQVRSGGVTYGYWNPGDHRRRQVWKALAKVPALVAEMERLSQVEASRSRVP